MPYKNIDQRRAYDLRRRPLQPFSQIVLTNLVHATELGRISMASDLGPPLTVGSALLNLEKRKLAKRVGDHLWQATLGGLVHVRQGA